MVAPTQPYQGQQAWFYPNGMKRLNPTQHSSDPIACTIAGVIDATHVNIVYYGYKGDGPYRREKVIYGSSQSAGTPYVLTNGAD